MNPDLPSTLPPCPVASGIIRRVAQAGPDYVERMWAVEKARCDICGHVNDIPRHYGDWQCSQCQQSYEYEEGHAIKLTDAQWKLLRSCRWIPVSERLPEEHGKAYLLACREGGSKSKSRIVSSGTYEGDGHWTPDFNHMLPSEVVTHWMPLPEPPSA